MEPILEERHDYIKVQHGFRQQLQFHLFQEMDSGICTCEHEALLVCQKYF